MAAKAIIKLQPEQKNSRENKSTAREGGILLRTVQII